MREERQIARLTIAASLEYLPAVMGFVRQVVSSFGLSDAEAGRLELVTEEACVNVIEHAFDPGEKGWYDIVILHRPGQVVVAVEDRGLPFDFRKLAGGEQSGLGMVLMKAFADEINFLNLGRQGKRVELAKNLPHKALDEYAPAETVVPGEVEPLPSDTSVTYRLMTPAEATALARCIYRSYGYTYMETIYYPEQVRELLEAGLMTSFAAVAEDGEIAGHVAITREHRASAVGDCGKGVVDPRYRSTGVLGKLVNMAMEHARKTGMQGIYGEATAVHPYSQKAAISLGWHECGALLGFAPVGMHFRHIQQQQDQGRTSVIICFGVTNQPPARDIYPPHHHQSMIRRVYERLKMNRNLVAGTSAALSPELPPTSRIDVRAYAGESWAFMNIVEFGADLAELVEFRLKELCLRNINCIYIDLPLSHPATQQFCASLEMLGFFFGAVIPELSNGDILRMQYLNNVEVRADEIHTATDWGRELLDYVLRARH
jgi:serine/threonine-protein kinase RsbW